MTAQHAPTPWINGGAHHALRNGGRIYWHIYRLNDPVSIATVLISTDGAGREQGEANACLIATSPGLLAAARAWLALDDRGLLPMTPDARAAVEVTRVAVAKVGA